MRHCPGPRLLPPPRIWGLETGSGFVWRPLCRVMSGALMLVDLKNAVHIAEGCLDYTKVSTCKSASLAQNNKVPVQGDYRITRKITHPGLQNSEPIFPPYGGSQPQRKWHAMDPPLGVCTFPLSRKSAQKLVRGILRSCVLCARVVIIRKLPTPPRSSTGGCTAHHTS